MVLSPQVDCSIMEILMFGVEGLFDESTKVGLHVCLWRLIKAHIS